MNIITNYCAMHKYHVAVHFMYTKHLLLQSCLINLYTEEN